MFGIQVRQNLTDLFPGGLIVSLFYIGERQIDNRISPSQTYEIFPFPYLKPLKQILPVFILNRKKGLDHTHVQCLPKSPGPGDQGNAVPVFPPLPNKMGFVNIKIISLAYGLKILVSDSHGSSHGTTPLSGYSKLSAVLIVLYLMGKYLYKRKKRMIP